MGRKRCLVNRPFFSVVIPTHNRAEMLKDAIRSVLGQTFQEFEMLVVDDYSTDHTQEAVASFNDPRIIYIMNDRGAGGAGTRNAAIFRAKGEWVAFLDDDDMWLPQKLSLLHTKILENDGSAGVIYTGAVSYDFGKKCELEPRVPEKEGWLHSDLLYKNYIGTFSAVAIRTDLLLNVGGLDENFTALQDMELYTRIARLTSVAFIQTNLSYIRVANPDRITFSTKKKLESSILYFEKNRAFIRQDPKLRHKAASRVFIFALHAGNLKEAIKVLPWTFLGLFIDSSHAVHTFRSAFYLYKARLGRFLRSFSRIQKLLHRMTGAHLK